MNIDNYRIENKEHVNYHGRKTSFKLFERNGDSFIYIGNFVVNGQYLSDEKCIVGALKQITTDY